MRILQARGSVDVADHRREMHRTRFQLAAIAAVTLVAMAVALTPKAAQAETPTLFGDSQANPVGHFAGDQVIGDFDGDGIKDAAVQTFGSSSGITVMIGNGDGSFQAGVDNDTGPDVSRGIATGDFNGDGSVDLATVHPSSSAGIATVILGNGDGTFQPYKDIAVGPSPFGLATEDLDGDGDDDLVIANNDSTNATASAVLSNGDGTFQAPVGYSAGSGTWDVAVGDLNGDGTPDIAAANASSQNVSVLFNVGDGTGQFGPATNYDVGGRPTFIEVEELNDDGISDIVVAIDSDTVDSLLGLGDGTFKSAVGSNVGGLYQGAFGDINGDGSADAAVSSPGKGTFVSLNRGDGTFYKTKSYSMGAFNNDSAIADLDGDDLPDLAVTGSTGQLNVALHTDPVATFGAAPVFPQQIEGTNGPERMVKVTNTGDAGLKLMDLDLTGEGAGDFGITRNSCRQSEIAAGKECEIGLRFSPGSSGDKSATLVLRSNSSKVAEMALVGTGIVTPPNSDNWASLADLKVNPLRRSVKRGGKTTFNVKVRNNGDNATAKGVRICVRAPGSIKVAGKKCRKVGKLAAGKAKVRKFKAKITRRAKRGASYDLLFTAKSNNTANRSAVGKVKVKAKKKAKGHGRK